jgi:hypothetical protein
MSNAGNGHYSETTHTALGLEAAVSAGGTASARCIDCHNPINSAPTSLDPVDQLYNQHQGLPAPYANTTCFECHNKNPLVTAVVRNKWPNNLCSDCHNSAALLGMEQHGTTPPAVVPSAVGAYQDAACDAAGCHAQGNIHATHKDAASCQLSGCHDYTKQAKLPVGSSCGVAGGCHADTAALHSGIGASHDASAVVMTAPGTSLATLMVGAASTGFSDGFETGSLANWTSADQPSTGATTAIWDAGMENWTSLLLPATPALTRAFDTVTTTTQWTLRTGQNNGATAVSADYARYQSGNAQSARLISRTGMNLSGYSSARVDWSDVLTAFNTAGNTVSMEWYNGTAWTTEWSLTATNEGTLSRGNWAAHSVVIPSAKLGTNCGVRFVVTSTAGATRNFYLDDLKVYGVSPAATGGWAALAGAAKTGAYGARAVGTGPQWYYMSKIGISLGSPSAANLSYAIRWDNLENTDDVVAQYTINGTTWLDAKNYAPGAADPASLPWTTETISVPSATTGIRFGLYADSPTGDALYIDDISVAAAGTGTAGTSCTSGTECHSVTDVRTLHANTAAKCTACHNATFSPTTKNCQASGCHAGVNLDEHVATGVGAPAHHETGNTFASYATSGDCSGCHDDSMANEHFKLTGNTSKPCSTCHATNYTVGTYSPAKATVTARITAEDDKCDGCHTTSTQATPHVQRTGTTATLGSVQFDNTWSGHKSFPSMLGAKSTSYGTIAGVANVTWVAPAASTYLIGSWQSNTAVVTCADCHGAMTGAVGPHGSSVTVNYATNPATGLPYDNTYSAGTLYNNNGTMSNTTNLCSKCHTPSMNYNSIHGDHQSSSRGACTSCHTKIPHAWKRPRLIGYTTDPAPYATKTNGIARIRAFGVSNPTNYNWQTSDCQAGCTGTHNGAPAAYWP